MSTDTPSPPKQSEMNDLNDTTKQVPQSEAVGSNVYYAQVVEKDYAWKEEQENILKKWADKALCFKMMHEKAYKRYWCLNAWFNIPIIIISTITGTGNFASGNFITGTSYFIFALGALNLFGGILATIATYTGVAQKLEAHRFSSINWDKFTRRIQIELAKSRKDRVKARDFIRQSAEEYDRLIEMSPILPNDIVSWFTKLIRTDRDDSLNGPCSCCFDWFCFACGCNINCCCPIKDSIDSPNNLKSEWEQIEVPEIIGRIKPTQIAPIQPQTASTTLQPKIIAIRSENNNIPPILSKSQSNYDIRRSNVGFIEPSTINPNLSLSSSKNISSSKYTPKQIPFTNQFENNQESFKFTTFQNTPQIIPEPFNNRSQISSPIKSENKEIEMKTIVKSSVVNNIQGSASTLKIHKLSDSSIDVQSASATESDDHSDHTDNTL